MKFSHYTLVRPGIKFQIDTELEMTHVVMGQRDQQSDEKNLPDTKGKTEKDFTPDQLVEIAKFKAKCQNGWYAFKPLAWATSIEEANAYIEKFTNEGRINVVVDQIDQSNTLIYA